MPVADGAVAVAAVGRLEKLLRLWGAVYGPDRVPEWDEGEVGESGSLGGTLGVVVRAARARRRVGVAWERRPLRIRMRDGRWAEVARLTPDAGLTARGVETRRPAGGWWGGVATRPERGGDAAVVERAWGVLYGAAEVRALVLRAEYCVRGTRRERVEWVEGRVGPAGGRVVLLMREYRAELAAAKRWMAAVCAPGAVMAVAARVPRRGGPWGSWGGWWGGVGGCWGCCGSCVRC